MPRPPRIIKDCFNMPIFRCPNLEIVYITDRYKSMDKQALYNMPKDMLFCAFIFRIFEKGDVQFKKYFLVKNEKFDYYKNELFKEYSVIVSVQHNTTGDTL